jgi:hypothetical protein
MAGTQEFRAKGSPADFHSCIFDFGDGSKAIHRTDGLTSYDVNDQVDREKVRAVGRYAKGLTSGEYDADLSLEWLSQAWKDVSKKLTDLGDGVYGFKGTFTLTYTEQDGTPMTVVATDIMFKTRKRSGKQGTEGLKVSTDLDCGGRVYENGIGPFGEKL